MKAMRYKIALLSLLCVPVLVLVSTGGPAAAAPGARSAGVHAEASPPSTLGVYSPTFTGSAATGCASGCHLLTGPYSTPSTAHLAPAKPGGSAALPNTAKPLPSPRAARRAGSNVKVPAVSCAPLGPGCDTISTSSGGAVGVKGLNAVDSATQKGNPLHLDIEPPDQGLCAGNGYVVEDNNIGEILVFNQALKRESGVIPLDTLMGLTKRGWSSGGDISCAYDYANGGHWFYTEFVSSTPESKQGPFAGCFAAKANACYEGLAVTDGSSPFGPYHVYFVHADYNPKEPGYPYLLNDFAKIAVSRDAFLLFYDEFPLRGHGIGGGFFNGAQEFAFDKTALEKGMPVSDVTVARENMGLIPTPNGTCARDDKYHEAGVTCWYSVIPAMPPDPGQYDNSYGGSAFMLNTLDSFYNTGDNRLAVWYWTDLRALNSRNCSACSGIRFGGQMFTGVLRYWNNGSLPSGILAPQKAGPVPLAAECSKIKPLGSTKGPCPESGIATNGDNVTQASQAGGQLWTSASTEVDQTYAGGLTETHMAAVYWVVGLAKFDTSHVFSLTSQGYVSPEHEDLSMPAMAAEGSADGGNNGAIIDFTLTGNGGPYSADHGGFYPSTAYGRLTSTSGKLLGSVVNVADLGQAPQDGFTEYQGYRVSYIRPRWGDYSNAIFLPDSGGRIYFATNYIQYPNCLPPKFTDTVGTCGGTRDFNANWGTSVNYVVP